MKRRRRRFLLVTTTLLLALALWQWATHWYPSRLRWPRQGIDVSHYQGRIDWTALPDQGVDFAYIKASEGGDWRDPYFAENWAGAQQAGIAHGAYHFFTLCQTGAEQAANFLATVPADADMLPPVLDLEFLDDCHSGSRQTDVIGTIRAFIRPVEARFGKPVTLYLSREFEQNYAVSSHIARPLWLRSLLFEPHWGARPWTLWQASASRHLRGIRGRVDWDVEQSPVPAARPGHRHPSGS